MAFAEYNVQQNALSGKLLLLYDRELEYMRPLAELAE
jgi:hypothetical protein